MKNLLFAAWKNSSRHKSVSLSKKVNIEEIVEWLEDIWLNGDLEGYMTEEEYLEFIEAVKSGPE